MDILLIYCIVRKVGHKFIALYNVCARSCANWDSWCPPPVYLNWQKTTQFFGKPLNVKQMHGCH